MPCALAHALRQQADALHAVSCAAGYNLRWLMRAILRLGIGPAFLCLLQMVLSLTGQAHGRDDTTGRTLAMQ